MSDVIRNIINSFGKFLNDITSDSHPRISTNFQRGQFVQIDVEKYQKCEMKYLNKCKKTLPLEVRTNEFYTYLFKSFEDGISNVVKKLTIENPKIKHVYHDKQCVTVIFLDKTLFSFEFKVITPISK
jgi:hypothetical protein